VGEQIRGHDAAGGALQSVRFGQGEHVDRSLSAPAQLFASGERHGRFTFDPSWTFAHSERPRPGDRSGARV
jgi:hypothetical protein